MGGALDAQSRPKVPPLLARSMIGRAVKALPLSGELWAVQLRQFASLRTRRRMEKAFASIFDAALLLHYAGNEAARGDGEGGIEAAVLLVLGKMDAERELLAVDLAGERGVPVQDALAKNVLWADTDRWALLFGLLSFYIAIIRQHQHPTVAAEAAAQAAAGGYVVVPLQKDEQLRLEKLATAYCLNGRGTESLAEEVWEDALLDQPDNVQTWSNAALYRAGVGNAKKARSTYKIALARKFGGAGAGAGEKEKEKLELMLEWERFEMCFGATAEVEYVRARTRQQRELVWKAWVSRAACCSPHVPPR